MVIIESTFIEDRFEYDDKKYKKYSDKKHMFLFQLSNIFATYPKTKFLLIHFSASYDKNTIKRYVKKYNDIYGNVDCFL